MTDRDYAYRYDLFIAPEWNARFDAIIEEKVELPTKGTILEINCGTGLHVIEMSEKLEEGQVVGIDGSSEMLAIARAKAAALDAERCTFAVGDAATIDLGDSFFDVVIADLSLTHATNLESVAASAARLTRQDGMVVLKASLRGSFDEFSSIYWEALHELELEGLWPQLEVLVLGRPSSVEVNSALERAGLDDVQLYPSKEEFRFDTGAELMTSPLVGDLFLDEWLSIVPENQLGDVRLGITRIIDRERGDFYFDFSAKALVATGKKKKTKKRHE